MEPIDINELARLLAETSGHLARAKGLKTKSRYPYYNEDCAQEIKEAITTVLSTREPMIWPARDVTEQTLYNKWKQGLDYLVHALDPAFVKTANLVTCQKVPKLGLRIAPVVLKSGLHLLPEVDWRPRFITFIETSSHRDKFELVIPLSNDDINWITEQLTGIEHLFIGGPHENGITLVRYDHSPIVGTT